MHWQIHALDSGGREVASAELTTGDLTIGRDPECQLVLPSVSVSRRHARLFVEGGQPWIADLNSANGVLVAGTRIAATSATALGDEARVEIGEYRLTVERRRLEAPPLLRLIVVGGPLGGRTFELGGGEVAVGRAADNQLVIDDPSLSRHHARLSRREAALVGIKDLDSANGTYLNDQRVEEGTARIGDLMRFGEVAVRIEGATTLGTSQLDSSVSPLQIALLAATAAVTLALFFAMVVVLTKPPRRISAASSADAIARLVAEAGDHGRTGRTYLLDRKLTEARREFDVAIELDPANAELRHLRAVALRGSEDDKIASAAQAKIAIGDRKALEEALELFDDTTEGTPAHGRLAERLVRALVVFGVEKYSSRRYDDAAWALCRAWEVAPSDRKPDPGIMHTLREAERNLHDNTRPRCRAGD